MNIKKLYNLLNKKERKNSFLLLGLIFLMAVLDMIGVASIFPFIAVLSNPQIIETNNIFSFMYKIFNFNNELQFQFVLGLISLCLLILSLGIKSLTTFSQLRFALMLEYSFSKRLMEKYIKQPYSWFLDQNSSDIGKNILSEVGKVIGYGVMPSIALIAQSATSLALIVLLLIVDASLAISVGAIIGFFYLFVFKYTKHYLKKIGQEHVGANAQRFSIVNEAFSAIKEIKIRGLESTYTNKYSKPAELYAKHQSAAQVVGQLPRYALEGVAFGGMLLIILVMMKEGDDFISLLPILSLYAFAGYRLMPALQQVYAAVTQLQFVGASLDKLYLDNTLLRTNIDNSSKQKNITFKKLIELKDVSYKYPNTTQNSLNKVNIKIKANSTVGLVGATGSGKTTTIDVILGLLEVQKGELRIDNVKIDKNNRLSWQKMIGYVPQQIYLADTTISNNIAFGLTNDLIDFNAVENAAKIANLHDFVTNHLPNGYQTVVGERGVRLSGGQRQRIAIARALYSNPKILIFDEATSALDNLTEQIVVDSIKNLGQEITIIFVAHRLTTVQSCDQIFLINNGIIEAKGTFNDLLQQNRGFKKMASIAS